MNMNVAGCAGSGAGRDDDRGDDAGHPLKQHQPCEHTVGAPVDGLLAFLQQVFRALLYGLFYYLILEGLVIHKRSPFRDFGVRKVHPKTGEWFCSAVPVVTNETMDERPMLSPAWPRDAVMPPLKSSFPPASYSIV